MNDTPVAVGDTPNDLDAAIDRLSTDDPAESADRAEDIARRLAVELDPPTDAGHESTARPPN